MALDKHRVFVMVADNRSITKTAEKLNYTQSAISHIIKNLEDEIGVQLIIRSKYGIHLTPQGEDLLPIARQIVKHENIFDQQAAMLRNFKRGTIRVGSFSSVSFFWMPPIIKLLKEKYPDITIIQTHDNYPDIENHVNQEVVDCGFLSAKHRTKLDFIPLVDDEYYVILSPDHPLCRFERIPIEALDGERMVLMDDGGEGYDTMSILKNLSYTVVHWVNEDFLALPLVECGLGISILPKLIIDIFCNTTNVVTKRFAVPRYRTIGIVVKNINDISPLTKLFISTVQDFVKNHVQK